MRMATAAKRWTLEEVHSLPDDGNKYELIDGELFVTPAPTVNHEAVGARLARILEPYVVTHALGFVLRPRAVVQRGGSEVEPDIMVGHLPGGSDSSWNTTPLPVLVVEIHSDTTWRRDRVQKRNFYLRLGLPEYWMVDADKRSITVVRPGVDDVETSDRMTWLPPGVTEPLNFSVRNLFA